MKKIIHSPLFWMCTTLISLFLYYFSFQSFPKAFPLVTIAITMDLEQARNKAHAIAQKNNLGPSEYSSAATFHTDSATKTFIELEAGGVDAFTAMMDKKLYMPYTWQVRHFKEFEKNEVIIRFTPDGMPYGFTETISENNPGAQLSEAAAEKIAQNHATTEWNINFNEYKRVEASQKEQPSKRIDHAFVYERLHESIGEGFYRLKIYVSGDKVTEITPFVKIPEAFYRRYNEMRSANTTIAWAATLLMGLLYGLCGCGLGLFFIFKKRWELWKQPLLWAFIIALSQSLTFINQLPSLWMYYPSAYSAHNYLIQLLLRCLSSFCISMGAMTIIIMAAESLTRYAFGHHPQLWSLWIPRNAASYAVLARTWGSYLLVGCMSAFVISFYLFTTRYLGWWTPADILFNPNILATYVPWLSPVAQSLQAGFLEECLFRAIPLASAAILGAHYGRRNLFIGIAFIVQAIIFSAAHANYATQPAYARLVELIIPSFIFGATYLRFGLLPSIITHVIYDLIWFSIPIFVTTSASALLSKIMIIVVGALPLLVIAYARFTQGGWNLFDTNHTNIQWKPAEKVAEKIIPPTTITTHIPQKTQGIILLISIISCIILAWTMPLKHDSVTIHNTQKEAMEKADAVLQSKDIELNTPWQKIPLFFAHYSHLPTLSMQHRFIWREGKKDVYHNLLNNYLQPAHWTVRYAQFEGDLLARAEEHKIMFYDTTRHYHHLPESQEGTALTKEQARAIAHKALEEHFMLSATEVEEISAQENQLPHRKNWTFTFADTKTYPLDKGQARIAIIISGDKVTDAARFVHVPEEWERNTLNETQKVGIINLIFLLVFVLLFIIASIFAHKEGLLYAISPHLWIIIFALLSIISALDLYNAWSTITGNFNTSAPRNNQLFQVLGGRLFSTFLKNIGTSLLIAYVISSLKRNTTFALSTMLTGYGLGITIAALLACGNALLPHLYPLWPDYTPLSTSIPLFCSILITINHYAKMTAYYSLLFVIINQATHYWHKHTLFFSLFMILSGFLIPLQSLNVLPVWMGINIIIGLSLLLMYIFAVRHNSTIIPLATASIVITQCIQQGIFNAYPDAWVAAIINVCIILWISFIWFKTLHKQ